MNHLREDATQTMSVLNAEHRLFISDCFRNLRFSTMEEAKAHLNFSIQRSVYEWVD